MVNILEKLMSLEVARRIYTPLPALFKFTVFLAAFTTPLATT